MRNILIILLVSVCSIANGENYITDDWCNANYGNKSDNHLVKQACEELVYAKKLSKPFDNLEKLDMAAKHITNYSTFLERSVFAQKALTKTVGEKTIEVLDGYIELADYMSDMYGRISIKVDSIDLKESTMIKHFELSELSTKLKAFK